MAKKTKPAAAQPAEAKPAAANAKPAKAKAPKAAAKPAKSAKAATKPAATKSAVTKSARRKPDPGPVTLPFESPAPKVASSLADRYASLEEAKSAAVDKILESIEAAEARLILIKRAASFAELEPLANGEL